MKQLIITILVCFSFSISQSLKKARPETVGISLDRLSSIDSVIEKNMENNEIVCAVTMVARKGKLVHYKAFGKADVEQNKILNKDDIFRIYSMTKPITTVAAMILYEEGFFQLHDPVHWYLPELKDVEVYAKNESDKWVYEKPERHMTIRDLMTHTSGLTYGLFGNTPVDSMYLAEKLFTNCESNTQFYNKLVQLPLVFHPGERWLYGVNTDILGYLVETISGLPLNEFFKERIFTPLGMKDTDFYVPPEKFNRFIVNYQWDADGERTIADHPSSSSYKYQPDCLSGGGGLVSTPMDYMRFCQMMLNGGELDNQRLLSPKSVEIMTTNHLNDAQKPTDGVTLGNGATFGLGFRITTDIGQSQELGSVGTYGWGGLATTMFFIDPVEELIGIVMTQKFPTDFRIRHDFKRTVYQAIIQSYD